MTFVGWGHQSGEAAATRFLEQHWDGNLPVRPENLAQRVGVEVIGRGGLGDFAYPYSGFFEFRNGIPVIEYNITDPRVRKRFTIAHELGHFVLGHERAPRDYPDSFGSRVGSPIEVQANQFAAELLMPVEAVRYLVSIGTDSIDELASIFDVSKVAMGHRLNNLNY